MATSMDVWASSGGHTATLTGGLYFPHQVSRKTDGRTVALFNVLHFGVQQLQRAIAVAEKRNIRRKEQRQALAVKD